MRFAIRLLVVSTAVALVACGSDPVPVAERFPTEGEAPGSKPDPDEEGQTTEDYDDFLADLTPALVDPDREEMTTAIPEEDFVGAGLDVLYFGETHSPEANHLFSWFIEVESDDAAGNVLDFLEADTMKPCPESCAVTFSSFDVNGIPGARGVHRIATAEAIEAAGTENEVPSESYWIGFTVGPVAYTVDLHGQPGSVSESQALEIATAFNDRLTSGGGGYYSM